MAWFGESLANIKGQISSFTKEVLAENPEDEEIEGQTGTNSGELQAAKKLIIDLQALCEHQKNEIEKYKLSESGFQDRSKTVDVQNKSLLDLYQTQIAEKDEENRTLQSRIISLQEAEQQRLLLRTEEVQKEEILILQKEIEDIHKEYRAKPVVSEVEKDFKPQPELCSISIQTIEDRRDLETCDVHTNTEFIINDDSAAKAEQQESYLREVEERCNAYQADLYLLRGELMTVQADADKDEEERAKFNEEILLILHSEFLIDGQPALPKAKLSFAESNSAGEQVILSALRQLVSIWRSLNDKKGVLERTVTKLSSTHNNQGSTSSSQSDIELPVDELQNLEPSGTHEYFPQRLDSFGLETIEEEERNEEENKLEGGDGGLVQRSKVTDVEVPSKPEVECCSSFTQTDVSTPEENPQDLKAIHNEKEKIWSEKSEQQESKIQRLEHELERLKNHLVDLEDQHTSEMLVSEETERELRARVAELQKQISQVLQQSERSSEVRDEIARLEMERDFARAQGRSYEEQWQKLNLQLQNLNFVLEQFQKEKEVEIEVIKGELQTEISQLEKTNRKLREEVDSEKELLDKARSGLDAARQLNLQIEEKSRIITSLKLQIQEGDAEITKLKAQLEEYANNNVAKVDRYLIKNLIVGYFSTPPDKRHEVLRVIATVLDFNREDRQKTGLESTSLWPFKSSDSSSSTGEKQSLSQAFIHFLEAESLPKTQIRIPMEEMARKHSHSRSASESESGSGGPVGPSSTSLAATEISMTLPVLNQADRSNSILKDVLNPRT